MILAQTLAEAVAKGYGDERPFLCPVHEDSRPSASVNVLKNVWVCYTCGAHGKVGGEALLGDVDFRSLKRHVMNRLTERRIYPESWLGQYHNEYQLHPYWQSRFTDETIRHFKLGYDVDSGRVTYPLRLPSGEVLGVVRRALDPEDAPKYKYPFGNDIGQLLFNFHEAVPNRPLVLVEGAVDAMALWEAGVNAVAIYGSRLSGAQVQLITQLEPTHVYCAFDMDKAGWQAARTAIELIKGYRVERITWNNRFKDPADMAVATRQRVFVNAVV